MSWRILTIDQLKADVPYACVGGPFGSDLTTRDYVSDGVPVIRGSNLSSASQFLDSGFVFVSEEKAATLSSNQARPGDVIFTQRGTLGQVGLIPPKAAFDRYIVSQSQMKLTVNPELAMPEFVYWWFRQLQVAELVKRRAITSGVPHINLGILKSFELRVPSLQEQAQVVEKLGEIENLIENNRRRIQLLEQSARLLYREWFVRLRFPGHEHVRVVDGVPEGWVRKSLGEVADFRLGKMLDQNKNKGDLMPYLANVNVRWGEIDLQDLREMRFEEKELETFGLRYGDIVMCEGGEPGRCAVWKEQLPKMMIQKAIHRIRAHPELSHLFLYYCLRHLGQSGQMAMLFTGATIKHLPREKLALVKIDVPPARLMTDFVEQVEPVEKQISLLETANRRASQARNLLLPRLMSGESMV